ncbi:MAG: hypothetical protein HGA25_00200 [Clostridiales bacterium]|nr:hypothetical protein [Clostridiales bacterium]
MLEIVLLIIGIVIFAIGIFMPQKATESQKIDEKKLEQQLKESVMKELEAAKGKIEDIVEETVAYSVDKTERAIDRLTNEKILAVNEYSDTVLATIHKNHEEAVFLYDMLTDKQKAIKNSVSEINKVSEKATVKKSQTETTDSKNDLNTEKTTQTKKTETKAKGNKKVDFEPMFSEKVDVSIQFTPGQETSKNSNERILNLHKAGKSNVAIAKELGLGIGEVKLVIDLYKGV